MSTTCSVKPAIAARPRTVSVNGIVIPREDIARETQNHPAGKPIEAWQAAARALTVRELLLQEARRLGVPPVPRADDMGRRETDDEAMMRALVEQEVRTPEPDDETCKHYYESNRSRFRSPDLYEVSHILIPLGANGDRLSARVKAYGLLEAMCGEQGCFATLARLHSACPSREQGGNLGQIGPGKPCLSSRLRLPAWFRARSIRILSTRATASISFEWSGRSSGAKSRSRSPARSSPHISGTTFSAWLSANTSNCWPVVRRSWCVELQAASSPLVQ